MAKHANKRTRSTSRTQCVSKKAKLSASADESPVPRGMMEIEMRLLTPSGVDEGLATQWFTAIATDELGASIMCAELLAHSGANPFGLRWHCKVIKHAMPASAGVMDVYKLAHLCDSQRVLTWLLACGIDEDAEEAIDALSRLSAFLGDGHGNAAEINFARQVVKALFVPDSAEQAQGMLDRMRLFTGHDPRLERFVREACLSLLAKEEESLLREATSLQGALPRDGARRTRL